MIEILFQTANAVEINRLHKAIASKDSTERDTDRQMQLINDLREGQ